MFFFRNHAENKAERLVPDFLLFFKKALCKVKKSKWSAAWLHYISIALKLAYNKNKLCNSLDYWSRDIPNFDVLEKSLGIVSPPHFAYDFSTKMFLYILLIGQISLSEYLSFFRYWAICVLQLFVDQVVTS